MSPLNKRPEITLEFVSSGEIEVQVRKHPQPDASSELIAVSLSQAGAGWRSRDSADQEGRLNCY
jgi:hypothetical protein